MYSVGFSIRHLNIIAPAVHLTPLLGVTAHIAGVGEVNVSQLLQFKIHSSPYQLGSPLLNWVYLICWILRFQTLS